MVVGPRLPVHGPVRQRRPDHNPVALVIDGPAVLDALRQILTASD